jgi:hypothetical protein
MRNQYKVLAEKYGAIYENRIDNTMTSAREGIPINFDSEGIKKYKTKDGYRYEFSDGVKMYKTKDGDRIVRSNGDEEWYKHGKRHRLDGPAVVCVDVTKEWWVNGKHHRLDGPAVEDADGYKEWYVDDKLHRLDGPAIEYANGAKQWFIDGEEMTEDEVNIERQRRDILKKASDETGIEMDI